MQLLTSELRHILPPLYATENEDDTMVHCKFFNPVGSGTWLILEYDGNNTLFGFVHFANNTYGELGYIPISELKSYKGPLNLGIERDLHFQPKPLSEAKRELGL